MNSVEYTALVIVIALIVVAFIMVKMNKSNRKKEAKGLWNAFDDFAIEHNLALDKKQQINKSVIGIDRLHHKLIFLDKTTGKAKFHLINLADLAQCRLVKRRNAASGHISNIYLQCIFRQKDTADICLPFYNEFHDDLYELMRLSRKAYYWEKRINIFRQAAQLSGVQ